MVMAKYPGMVQQRGVRSSTIVESATKQNAAGSERGSITSKSLASPSHTRITADEISDPDRLLKVLNDVQDSLASATQGPRSNPYSTPCIVRGLTFGPQQVVVVPHTLGRNYSDWHPTSFQGAAPSLLVVPPGSTLYPPQLSPAKVLVLVNGVTTAGATATCSVVIVGD
jgi:hypothetical protein